MSSAPSTTSDILHQQTNHPTAPADNQQLQQLQHTPITNIPNLPITKTEERTSPISIQLSIPSPNTEPNQQSLHDISTPPSSDNINVENCCKGSSIDQHTKDIGTSESDFGLPTIPAHAANTNNEQIPQNRPQLQPQPHPQDLSLAHRLRYNTITDQETFQWSIPVSPLPPPILTDTDFDIDLALRHAWIGSLLPPNWVLYILSLASELFVEEPNLLEILIKNDVQLPSDFTLNNSDQFSTPQTPPLTTAPTQHSEEINTLDINVMSNLCIVGDLHGQFFDLLQIFRKNDVPPRRRYLFLGDFVDRGACSLETIMLLLILKVKYPLCVYLLRGNHESSLSTIYGFKHEVLAKYPTKVVGPKLTRALVSKLHNTPLLGKPCDPKLGKPHCVFTPGICKASPFPNTTIYSQFLYLFMTLPLAAVVVTPVEDGGDGTGEAKKQQHCFCVHGGISPQIRYLNSIEKIYRFIEVEDISSSPVVDMLWSDPTLDFKSYHKNNRGCGYIFGKNVWDLFVKDNNLDTIIRSHELKPYGLQIYDDKVITVWSAPNYLRHYHNKAAVIILRSPNYDKIQQQLLNRSVEADNNINDNNDGNSTSVSIQNGTALNTNTSLSSLSLSIAKIDDDESSRQFLLTKSNENAPKLSNLSITLENSLSDFAQHQLFHADLRKKRKYNQKVHHIYHPLYTTTPPHPYYIYADNDSAVDREVHQQLVVQPENIPNSGQIVGTRPLLRVQNILPNDQIDGPTQNPNFHPNSNDSIPTTSHLTPTNQHRPTETNSRPKNLHTTSTAKRLSTSTTISNGSCSSSTHPVGGATVPSVSSWFEDSYTPATQHQPPRPRSSSTSSQGRSRVLLTSPTSTQTSADDTTTANLLYADEKSPYHENEYRSTIHTALTTATTLSSKTISTSHSSQSAQYQQSSPSISPEVAPSSPSASPVSLELELQPQPRQPQPHLQPQQLIPNRQPTKLLYHIVDIEQFPDQFSNEIISLTNPLKHASFSSVYGELYTSPFLLLESSLSFSSSVALSFASSTNSTPQQQPSMLSISQTYFGTPLAIDVDSPSVKPISHRQRRPSSPSGGMMSSASSAIFRTINSDNNNTKIPSKDTTPDNGITVSSSGQIDCIRTTGSNHDNSNVDLNDDGSDGSDDMPQLSLTTSTTNPVITQRTNGQP